MSSSCGVISIEYCELLDRGVQKKKLLDWLKYKYKYKKILKH